MLFVDGGFGLILLGLWLFCIFDVITTDASQCRNLPKAAWVMIVLVLPDIGSIAWLVAGHEWGGHSAGMPYKSDRGVDPRTASRFPEYDRPGRRAATNPDDDEEFLAQVKERAEQQRRAYEQKRQAELQAEQDELRRRRPEDE